MLGFGSVGGGCAVGIRAKILILAQDYRIAHSSIAHLYRVRALETETRSVPIS